MVEAILTVIVVLVLLYVLVLIARAIVGRTRL